MRSAGLLGMSERQPSKPSEAVLTEMLGIDASNLRSRSVTRALKEMGDIDMVLCFEQRHVAEIVRRFPNLCGKVFLFSKLARNGEGPPDIVDPHGAAAEAYLAYSQRIEKTRRSGRCS